ncbi:MAG: glycosyltransferase [Lentisphaerae bacterium]|nr:glycosyltransferase [Lentisphaerota bacterium]
MSTTTPPVSPPDVPPRVTAIVVTHNHAHYLGDCLDSLVRAAGEMPLEIIVIDNRSDDDSARLAAGYPGVRVHVNEARRGFAANSNFGMALAQGRYWLVLNPDTVVQPGALTALAAYMDQHPRVGICGPRLQFPDGPHQPSARRFPTLSATLVRRTPLRLVVRDSRANQRHLMQDEDLSAPRSVDWLLGACLFIRREAIDAVGPFDEGYTLYVEDIDLGRRMHAGGWDIVYVPEARIVHHHLAVSDKHLVSRRTWVHTQSMWRYARKYWVPRLPWLAIRFNCFDVWRASRAASRGPVAAHRPRALFLHHGGELYGSDEVLRQAIESLSAQVEPAVVLDSSGPLVDQLLQLTPRVRIRRLGILRRKSMTPWGMLGVGWTALTAGISLAVRARREHVALIYSNTGAIMAGAVAARLAGLPHVWHLHEIVTKPAWFARGWARVVTGQATRVIAVSAAVRDHLLPHAPQAAGRICVVHNAVSSHFGTTAQAGAVRAEFGLSPEAFVIVLVGRIHFWKGQDFFLKAAARLKQKGAPAFHALIVGDVFPGYEDLLRQLKQQVRDAQLDAQVVFAGYRRDVAAFMAAADVVVLPSVRPEPFALVTLEAMHAGIPVVATRLGGYLEQVEDGVTGYLVSPTDPDEMADRLLELARDRARREAMGRAARQRLDARFGPAHFAAELQKAVLPLVGGKAP